MARNIGPLLTVPSGDNPRQIAHAQLLTQPTKNKKTIVPSTGEGPLRRSNNARWSASNRDRLRPRTVVDPERCCSRAVNSATR